MEKDESYSPTPKRGGFCVYAMRYAISSQFVTRLRRLFFCWTGCTSVTVPFIFEDNIPFCAKVGEVSSLWNITRSPVTRCG